MTVESDFQNSIFCISFCKKAVLKVTFYYCKEVSIFLNNKDFLTDVIIMNYF